MDKIDSLFKNDDSSEQKHVVSSRKLDYSINKLSMICKQLTVDSKEYSPEETINTVVEYIGETNKLDRILYSQISAFIVSLGEEERGTFSTNIENLLLYVLDESNHIGEDVRKIITKIYDHFQLNLIQIESANKITQRAIIKSLEDEKINLHKEVREVEKEYITILGIFAAIMLAFVGSFTFSTSVLNNISSTNANSLSLVALIIGLVFLILITVLIDFLREINGKTTCVIRRNVMSIASIVILSGLIIAVICLLK